jgi:putative ABC transport system permease protein
MVTITTHMLKNYFLVALRHFWRHRTFSLINIFGLAIGISASLVIFLIVSYDLSFDKFEPGRDRIYRISSSYVFSGEPLRNSGVCYPLPQAVAREVSGVELVATFRTADEITKVSIPYPDAREPAIYRKQSDITYADGAYCSLLGYRWLAGSPATAFSQPYALVLTETSAASYFPGLPYEQVMGKHVVLADSITTTVTGVLKDLPGHTDFYCHTIISWATLLTKRMQPEGFTEWGGTTSASQLFIRLAPGTSVAGVTAQLKAIYDKHNKPAAGSHDTGVFVLGPLNDLHFDTDFGIFDQSGRVAHRPTLYGLMAVAAFLLLLGCINFINLTTAQAASRAKEIGIRKTMGSQRLQLALQFLNETFLLTLIATILSVVLVPLLLRAFADFIPKEVVFSVRQQPAILVFLLVLAVVVSLLSGAYPALVLSSFKPISVLKNQWAAGAGKTRGLLLRKTLTVSQFVIAQVFIIATILVARQINFALHAEMGFKKDAILTFSTAWRQGEAKRQVLAQKLAAIPGIGLISQMLAPPASGGTSTDDAKYNDGKHEIRSNLQYLSVDTNYLRLFHLHLLAGRNISESDTINELIINATYARTLGFSDPRKAVGARIKWNERLLPVVGVVADFHQASMHMAIRSLAIVNGIRDVEEFAVALPKQDAAAWKGIISRIEDAYRSVYPEDEFSYEFFDESIAKFYTQEQNISRLLIWATGLAIFISCLGLLGLVIYITNQRTKEIGVRKVIGASVMQIVVLLSKDFVRLIGVAILISIPIAWWGGHRWMADFAYRADLSWWIFAGGAAALLLVALIVLCIRAYRAASANPVSALRSE